MNLIDDPWVPVMMVGGDKQEFGLHELIERAHEIRALDIEPTFVRFSVFRLALAFVLDAFGPPESADEFVDRLNAGRFDSAVLADYADEVRDRFNLFDAVAPFYQVAGLQTPKGETKSVAALLPQVPAGNNVPLYGVRTDAEPPVLTPSEATRWLIAAQSFDTAGIKSGAHGDPLMKNGKVTAGLAPLGQMGVVVATGRNLFESVLINMVVDERGRGALGSPVWRRDAEGPGWTERQPEGQLDWLTFQARRIRLVPERSGEGLRPTVSQVVVAAGDKHIAIPEYEPHATWRTVKNPRPEDPPRRPVRVRSDWAAWQGLASLLATGSTGSGGAYQSSPVLRQIANFAATRVIPRDYPLEVAVAGIEYGNMQAVVENTMADSIPLSVVALRSDSDANEFLLNVVESHERLANALNDLDRDLREIHSAEAVPWDKGQRLGTQLTHRVDPVVRRLLEGLQREPDKVDQAMVAWRGLALRLTFSLGNDRLASVPVSAYRGARSSASGGAAGPDAPIVNAERSFRGRVYAALKEFEPTESKELSHTKERAGSHG